MASGEFEMGRSLRGIPNQLGRRDVEEARDPQLKLARDQLCKDVAAQDRVDEAFISNLVASGVRENSTY